MKKKIAKWLLAGIAIAIVLVIAGLLSIDFIALNGRRASGSRRNRNGNEDRKIQRRPKTSTIHIQNFVLKNPAEFGGDNFVEMPELFLEYDREALRSGRLHLNLVRIEVAKVHVVETKDGKRNDEELQKHQRKRDKRDGEKDKSEGPFVFDGVDKLEVTLQIAQFTSFKNPAQNLQQDLGIRHEIFKNLKTEKDFQTAAGLLALKAGANLLLRGDLTNPATLLFGGADAGKETKSVLEGIPAPTSRKNLHKQAMILLFDIGNTHTHLGIADRQRVLRQVNIATSNWFNGGAEKLVLKFLRGAKPEGAALCSVVPRATPFVHSLCKKLWKIPCLELTAKTASGVGIDYPKPETIGPDRVANAIAARHHFGAPSVVVDFGTAVTFDVVNAKGNYVGGIIAPGLAAMTDYLHEKTALLPRIKIRDVQKAIGKNTRQAMLIGAVHGYRGLVRELVSELKAELNCKNLPVIATGGYAKLIARKLPEIVAVEPLLTVEGLRLAWENSARPKPARAV